MCRLIRLLISEATVQPYQWNYLNDWDARIECGNLFEFHKGWGRRVSFAVWSDSAVRS